MIHRPVHCLALHEIRAEDPVRLHVHPHGPKDDGEALIAGVLGVLELEEGGLVDDLGGNLVVGEVCSKEYGDLLAGCDRVHDVDVTVARLHGFGVVVGERVEFWEELMTLLDSLELHQRH